MSTGYELQADAIRRSLEEGAPSMRERLAKGAMEAIIQHSGMTAENGYSLYARHAVAAADALIEELRGYR